MEGLRKALDNLMGKDRNLPIKEQILKKKHFDDPDVCKFFLIGFCPHELFTYVKSSNIGECRYRHDQQFKISFESDPNREYYQIKYEESLISFLESITSELDMKIKRCLERIELPPPEQVLNKDAQIEIENLNKEITEKLKEAEHLGEMGLIDQSEKLTKEIEQIKIQRNLLTNTKEHAAIYKDRQMKVCEICGALQSAIDNEKRIQTHKEGKIHSAYLKIRQYLDLLRKKRMERQIKDAEKKQKDKLMKELKVKEKEKDYNKDYKKRYDDYDKYDRDKRKRYSRSRSRDKSYSYSRKSKYSKDSERDRKKYDERYYDNRNSSGNNNYKDYKDYRDFRESKENKDYRKRDDEYEERERRKERDRIRDIRDREEIDYYYKDYKDRDRRNSYRNKNEERYDERERDRERDRYNKDKNEIKERRERNNYIDRERDKKERREYEKYYDKERERERDNPINQRIKIDDSFNGYGNRRKI